MTADTDKKARKDAESGSGPGLEEPKPVEDTALPAEDEFLDMEEVDNIAQAWPPTMAPFISGHVEGESLQANLAAVGTATADDVQANLSAVLVSKSEWLSSVGSAIGIASVGGDAEVNTSMIPIFSARGDASFHQAYASAFIAGGNLDISQAGAPIIVGKKISVDRGGAAVMMAGQAEVRNGFVGVLLAPKTTLSEDTRVLMSTKAALIIAAALLGGFGLVAIVMVLGVRRVMTWRPQISLPQLPALPSLESAMEHLRRHRR